MTKAKDTQSDPSDVNDPNYDPAKDPKFMERVDNSNVANNEQDGALPDGQPSTSSRDNPTGDPQAGPVNTPGAEAYGADPRGPVNAGGIPHELATGAHDADGNEIAPGAPYGYYPSGTPRLRPDESNQGGTPDCPAGVSISDGPFDTTTIPAGLSKPLSQECADFYNAKWEASKTAGNLEGPYPTNNPTEQYLKTDPEAVANKGGGGSASNQVSGFQGHANAAGTKDGTGGKAAAKD